jgi:hypothetical protein
MAYMPNRDDPYLPSPSPSIEEMRRQERFDTELRTSELSDVPASSGRVALYAIAILAVLGALFYGLNAANNSSQTASNPSAPTSMAQTTPANPQPPIRNVTPGPNSSSGVTTGAAPATPAPANPAPSK